MMTMVMKRKITNPHEVKREQLKKQERRQRLRNKRKKIQRRAGTITRNTG